MSFVLRLDQTRELHWQTVFRQQMPEMAFHFWPECGNPEDVEYLALWKPDPEIFAQFPNLKLVFSLGAGVDQFDLSTLPPQVSLVRMIEPALTAGMVEYVTAFVLAIQRDLPLYRRQQTERLWQAHPERAAAATRVGIMGMGTLGTPCAKTLLSLGFAVQGWNRSPRDIAGVPVFAGDTELDAFLASTDILVCLLPLTDATRGLFRASLFSKLPKGASFINAGRGGHVVTDDLLGALDSGQLRWAVLDVTSPEPLPATSPLWEHPRIILTPHIASNTNAQSGAESVIANIRRFQAGQPPAGLVDRRKAY